MVLGVGRLSFDVTLGIEVISSGVEGLSLRVVQADAINTAAALRKTIRIVASELFVFIQSHSA